MDERNQIVKLSFSVRVPQGQSCYKIYFLLFFRKFEKYEKLEKKGAPALRVIRAETRLTVHRALPVAKPARLGSAENDEPMQNFVELARFYSMTLIKVHRIRFRAYVDDQYESILILIS